MTKIRDKGLYIKRSWRHTRTITSFVKGGRWNVQFNNITFSPVIKQVQSCPATTRLVITLIGCNAVGRASRFFRPLGFFCGFIFYFLSCIYFLTANCFIFYSRVVLQCMYFATMYFYHYVYCIFIRICFIALCRKIAH